MTEITQFNGKYVMHEGMFIYSCAPCNIDCSGRYIRESDYAALLERHRRLRGAMMVVDQHIESMRNSDYPYRAAGPYEKAKAMINAALAEEVDGGYLDNKRP